MYEMVSVYKTIIKQHSLNIDRLV